MINNDLQVVFIFLAKIMHGAINEDFSKFSLLTYLSTSSKCVMNWVCLKICRLADSLYIQSSTFWIYQIYINCSHFAFTWKKYQFNMHARIKYHANTEKYYSFSITIAKKVRKSLDKQWCDKKHQKVRRLQFPKPLSIMRFPETSLPGNDWKPKQLTEGL